jgi:hypothetical protein
MKTYLKIIISTIIAGSVASLTFADVPISTPTKYVECLCVTSASQTCVTREHGGDFLNVSNTLNSSCINGAYLAKQINDNAVEMGNAFTAYTGARGFYVGYVGVDTALPFIAIQTCSGKVDFLKWALGNFITDIICAPDFPGSFNPGPLGTDSAVACKRSLGATGTLHEAGNITIVSPPLQITGLPNGDGLQGCNGISGGCGVSGGSFPPVLTHQNYSCY